MAQRRGKRRKSDWYVICAETWDRTPQAALSNKLNDSNKFYVVSNRVLQVEPKQHIHPLSSLIILFICKELGTTKKLTEMFSLHSMA